MADRKKPAGKRVNGAPGPTVPGTVPPNDPATRALAAKELARANGHMLGGEVPNGTLRFARCRGCLGLLLLREDGPPEGSVLGMECQGFELKPEGVDPAR